MVTLWFVAGALLVGALLYLPFFLWFRHARRGKGQLAQSPRMAPAAAARSLLVALALVGGVCWLQTEHGPQFTALVRDGGILKIWLAICVWSAAMTAYTRGSGPVGEPAVAASRPETTPSPARSAPAGFLRVATFGTAPVIVHWRFLLSGGFIALLASRGVIELLVVCVAYAALFAIHEAAHALAARRLGLRVFSILLMGQGGLCVVQVPRSARDTFQVYVAGIAAQAVVLVATLAAVAIFGRPATPAAAALVMTFTWVNATLILVNGIPRVTEQGQPTDGAILWRLYRHVRRGEPHPHAAQHAASPVFHPSTRLLDIDGMRPAGFVTGIELLNDDTSPMELVVEMLTSHAGLDVEAATAAMMTIHRQGGLLLPLPDRAVAELAAQAITREAQARGHVLVCRAVSAA